ncbi:MAG: hypothetical protein DMG51_16425 [Acidobacteria bacterium]|nr:MAG: hypothetical protein DMG51_16425 [Acidobacteriota bacterium]
MKDPPPFHFRSLIRTLRNFSRKAMASAAPAARPGFQVQSLANQKERRGIMTEIASIGVVCSGGDAGGLASVLRGVVRRAKRTPPRRAAGAAFVGRA